MTKIAFFIGIIISFATLKAQEVPASMSNIHYDSEKKLYWFQDGERKLWEQPGKARFTVDQFINGISGTANGFAFDFGDTSLNGTLYYGLIPYGDGKYPLPVWFNRSVKIVTGKVEVDIRKTLSGHYDMTNWGEKGFSVLGYRVTAGDGTMLYDGKIEFLAGAKFSAMPTVIDGPFIDQVTENSAVISFVTNYDCEPRISVGGKDYKPGKGKKHELKISGLKPATEYAYSVKVAGTLHEHTFRTAPVKGENKKFTFAYVSDSRGGLGGGERGFYGPNVYIMRKIMALSAYKNVDFMQFTGDLINGYANDPEDNRLQFRNWKNAVQPFAANFPVYETMGNHEGLHMRFIDPDKPGRWIRVDRFPFESLSAEQVFAEEFANPEDLSLLSEDGSAYDPSQATTDFPSYKENAYSYTFGNTAMIVLNSNYWFCPDVRKEEGLSGNMHAYIMDNQFEWLKEKVGFYERDNSIKHIFVTNHTPMFPNGGHSGDDMWYSGDNSVRPRIAGKSTKTGIIERRDQILDLLVNQSKKVRAVLTGDEHNYNHLVINPEMEMYPDNWDKEKVTLKRTIYQINNGAAGAPYYAQEKLPWSKFCKSFTTRNALVFITVDGDKVEVQTINPDTLEEIETFSIN